MRKYLLTVVFKPEANKVELLKEIKGLLGEAGKVVAEEELALKRLAYEVAGTVEASIHQLSIDGDTSITERLTEALRVNDQVLRFLVKVVKEAKVAKAEVTKK